MPSPFNNLSAYREFRDLLKRYQAPVEYDELGLAKRAGYKRPPKSPKYKTITTNLGNVYRTPEGLDLDDYMAFVKVANGGKTEGYKGTLKSAQSLGDFIDYVFSKSSTKWDSVKCVEGSHILQMDYSQHYQMLRVYFEKHGNVCVYFHVPATVYATLEALAESPTTRNDANGVPRHLVGIYFWDLIRIRGTVSGSRYMFTYEQQGQGTGYKGALPGEKTAIGSPDARDEEVQLQKVIEELHSIGDEKGAQAAMETLKQLREGKKLAGKEVGGKQTKEKLVRLTAEDQAKKEMLVENYGDKPFNILQRKKNRTPDQQKAFALFGNLLKVKVQAVKEGKFGAKFQEGLEKLSGRSEIDLLLKQEDYLAENGLWP